MAKFQRISIAIIAFCAYFTTLSLANSSVSEVTETFLGASDRELTINQEMCAKNVEIFVAVNQNCPKYNKQLSVDKQNGCLTLHDWSEGTGNWNKFSSINANRKIQLTKKGKNIINICFYSAEYVGFKAMHIGETNKSPIGKSPAHLMANRYDNFVDVDVINDGLPTVITGDAIGFVHSGESLQFTIDVTNPGWYPVSYELSRSCKKEEKPILPPKCTNGRVSCGSQQKCCEKDESCYIGKKSATRNLFLGEISRELTSQGICCPPEQFCKDECCGDGKVCVKDKCVTPKDSKSHISKDTKPHSSTDNKPRISNDNAIPHLPKCRSNEYNCGIDECCNSDAHKCYIKGLSGPINNRALMPDDIRILTMESPGTCCPEDRCCRLECCPSDQTCVDGTCKLKNCPSERSCPNKCCPIGYLCKGSYCEKEGSPSVTPTQAPVAYDMKDHRNLEINAWKGEKYLV